MHIIIIVKNGRLKWDSVLMDNPVATNTEFMYLALAIYMLDNFGVDDNQIYKTTDFIIF